MATFVWMLELGRTGWRLHASRDDGTALVGGQDFAERELAVQAEPIHAALLTDGYQGEPIVVALESNWCLAATLPIGRPQELRDRRTMLYRLEEWIPWSAEDFVADFLAAGDSALAVAVRCEPLAEFLGRLAALDVHVATIAPVALLAAAEHIEMGDWPAQHVVVFQRNGWIDLVAIEDRKLTTWLWLPDRIAPLRRELDRLANESGAPPSVVGYGLDEAVTAELQQCALEFSAPEPTAAGVSSTALALTAARKVLQGQLEVPIELKRGPFGRTRGHVALRRYAAILQAAVAILLLAVAASLVYRGHAAANRAESIAAQQADLFRKVFPNTKVPVGVQSRLKSELAKLKGLHGDDTALPDSVSAIAVLHRLLSSLPTDRRVRLLEIRIEEGRLYLDGEVRGHSDAEAIAQRLRSEGFEVSPPRTQRLDGERVSLRITGNYAPVVKLSARKSS